MSSCSLSCSLSGQSTGLEEENNLLQGWPDHVFYPYYDRIKRYRDTFALKKTYQYPLLVEKFLSQCEIYIYIYGLYISELNKTKLDVSIDAAAGGATGGRARCHSFFFIRVVCPDSGLMGKPSLTNKSSLFHLSFQKGGSSVFWTMLKRLHYGSGKADKVHLSVSYLPFIFAFSFQNSPASVLLCIVELWLS